ncbi:MAG: inverse autotransporter beta domain-containing protein [Planctomycetaceae bacterium]|nr:inverse autotransporter beta domain-containing protein [Planctomycetaceae bacterium]
MNRARHCITFRMYCLAGLWLMGALLLTTVPARAQLDGRIGHTALPTVGRNTGISHLELFPYRMISDEQVLFGDFRGFISNEGRPGGNLGGGFRFLEPMEIFVLGVNGYYDVDSTTSKLYQQVGFGLEALTRFGGVTSNFYFPVGNDDQTLLQHRSNGRFEGNRILFDNLLLQGQAMRGVDVALSLFVPGEFAQEHQIEVTSGWYQFQASNTENINGFRIQVDGEIVPSVNAQVAVTSDEYFGPNVSLGLSWRFGNQGLPENGLERQLRRFVDRNYNVIVKERAESGTDIPLINPLTGQEYVVRHVSSAAIAGAGTAESPFASIAAAQGAGADVIFVHGSSTINESITLAEGQMLLGAGAEHTLIDEVFGDILIPEDVSGGNVPTLINSAFNAITMNNNSRLSGFNITNSNGASIVAQGIEDFVISDITINNPTGFGLFLDDVDGGELRNITINDGHSDGVHIRNVDGELQIANLVVNDAAGHGVRIQGGQGRIVFTENLTVDNALGTGFSVADLFTTTVVVDDQGTVNPDDDELEITEGTVIVENLVINAADGMVGVELNSNEGFIGFGQVDITTSNASALQVNATDRFFVGAGTLTSTNAPTVDVANSLVDIRLQSLFADGGAHGIRLVDAEGRLVVFGEGTAGSGGSIKNTDVAILMQDSEQLAVQAMNFDNNNVIAQIQDSLHFELASSVVTNTQTQFIDALNLRTLSVTGTEFVNNMLTADTGILFATDEIGTFVSRFNDNTVTQGPRRLFHATTLAGGTGAGLNYEFEANAISLTQLNGVAAGLDWTGTLQAFVNNNLITGTEGSQTAIDFVAGDTNNNAIFDIRQNGIRLDGQNSTGISIDSGAPMIAQANQNLIQLNGLNSIGMRYSGTKGSTFNLNQNEIVDFAGGGTGILFPTVFDGSDIFLNSNILDFSANNVFVDRGIIVNAVGGVDNPKINFQSNQNNLIIDASTLFSVPVDSGTGQLIINGNIVQ